MSKTDKKIIGLSCGRKNGNSEFLLKEACMAAEAKGVETEIIRTAELNLKPCRGCEACSIAYQNGREPKCAIEDDAAWILEKVIVEDNALIISTPVYCLMESSQLKIINDRMLPTVFRHQGLPIKSKLGAIICVGGADRYWTTLALVSANIFLQHDRKLVDQVQINYAGRPGNVLLHPNDMDRARLLGENMARALAIPFDEVEYMGDSLPVSCPVCHCNILEIWDGLPEVMCPICMVKGVIKLNGQQMTVQWDEYTTANPRYSPLTYQDHIDDLVNIRNEFMAYDKNKLIVLKQKYEQYDHFIYPPKKSGPIG